MVFATWKLRMHLIYFFNCSFARSCWAAAKLDFSTTLGEVFHTSIVSLLSLQNNLVLYKFFSVLWAIWGQRNNRVWGRQALPLEVAVRTAFEFCNEWKLARVNQQVVLLALLQVWSVGFDLLLGDLN